jgi:hypothetical protein
MAQRNSATLSTPGFVVDLSSITRTFGHQILWADVAAGRVNEAGKKFIPAGTVMILRAGKVLPYADRGAGVETSYGILETNALEGDMNAAISGYGVMNGGNFYENLLPEATGTPRVLNATRKTELRAIGTGYGFFQFQDSRLA